MKHESGPGAGPDGVRPADLTASEIGNIAGYLSTIIVEGGYWPGARLEVPIPKPAGGFRTLRIPNFPDRVVARRLQEALQPFIDPQFVDASYGFRPNRGTWNMLATLKTVMERTNKMVLVVCDVRKAFDSLRIDEVLASFQQLFTTTRITSCSARVRRDLLGFVELLLRGGDEDREVGIGTGCPFSPLALNAHLHMIHDLIFLDEDNRTFWCRDGDGFRYADNLVYPVHDVAEGRQVLDNIGQHFLRCDLRLKKDAHVLDLRSDDILPRVLGFRMRCEQGNVVFEVVQEALERLSTHLAEAHGEPDPSLTARQAVLGWISYMGPAFENGCQYLPEVVRMLDHHGFRESVCIAELEEAWGQSYRRWEALLRTVRDRDVMDGWTLVLPWQGSAQPN